MRYARVGCEVIGVTALLWIATACGSKAAGTGGSGAGGETGAGAATATTSTSQGSGAASATSAASTMATTGPSGTTTTGASSTTTGTTGASSTTATTGTAASSSTSSGAGGGTSTSDVWVMGYYTSWEDPANGGDYAVSSIDWDGLTHVATAFYLPDGNGGWMSGSFDAGTAASLITAAHGKGKKVLASIGGANSGAVFEGSTNATNLSKFVDNLVALLAMGYDGIDIDWEGGNLTAAQDQALESSLIQALRAKSPGTLLTFTAGAINENLLSSYSLAWYGTVAAQLDRINLMTYGMSGAYQGWDSWHSSPLHWNNVGSTPTGIDATVKHYLAAGVPAAKLGIGTGFYGSCYTAPVTAPVQALGASTISASDGTMSYPNIMASYYTASAYHYDSAAEAPYLTLSGNNAQKCTYVSYEDPTSIAAKGAWVKAQGLGGTIIWEISEGYVPSGATVQAQNPLLEATKTAFLQ